MSDGTLITMFGSAIAALFAALMWVIRLVMQRYERLIENREAERVETLGSLTKTVEALREAIVAATDAARESQREYATGQQAVMTALSAVTGRQQAIAEQLTRVVGQLETVARGHTP